ncbi:CHC2 zinc finger domain-containing protein, partial [Carboxylicivirga linearis]
MQTIEKVKQIDIKALIEKETGVHFNKANQLEKCPFCGSGQGTNHSPAFSVNTRKNYFKCFSCGSAGSAIDFVMLFNNGWNEHKAITYLQEDYLGIRDVFKPSAQTNTSSFDKMLFAIRNNPITKASEYLKSRGIDAESLPQGSYWYDSLSNAIVFTDTNNQLINRRMINPEKGKPKAKNNGTLNESIYDKMFFPDFDVVFLQEGVINALSMVGCSSIALFSTENKIKDPKVLLPYLQGKKVVLAMDNDDAGNKCADYYKDFILSGRFDIQSLRRLVLPKKKDANDLLQDKSLIDFLQNTENYQLLWEDIVTKPIPQNSEDKQADNEEYYFFVENGCYYMKETIKGKPIVKKLSNFLMESVYHLMDGTKESRRLVKFQRNTGEITVNEIMSSELNLDRFKKVIRSISSRGLTFFGNTQQLDNILTFLYDREKNAIAINQLGYQSEHHAYCFADAVIDKDNVITYPDKLGIVNTDVTSLYLPPFAYTNLNDKSYSAERRFAYKAGNLNFDSWAELIFKAYGINGAVGISFVILALYRDIILDITGFFPFLFLFGDQGAGKSN